MDREDLNKLMIEKREIVSNFIKQISQESTKRDDGLQYMETELTSLINSLIDGIQQEREIIIDGIVEEKNKLKDWKKQQGFYTKLPI